MDKVINKYLKIRVKTYKDIVKNTELSQATFFRRMADPDSFTVGELRQIFDYLKVQKEERVI